MTSEDVRSELEKNPFVPFRLHLASGKTVEIVAAGQASMLQNAVLVVHGSTHERPDGYDVIALRNIERLEQLSDSTARTSNEP